MNIYVLKESLIIHIQVFHEFTEAEIDVLLIQFQDNKAL